MNNGPLVQDLMPIGRFAQASRLSPKALRLYDELELLTPRYVDETSGYRYYHEAQLEQATLISRLRQLRMPLDRIALVIKLEERAHVLAIRAYWRKVEMDVSSRRKLVHYLESYLEGRRNTMYSVETPTIPEQKVATLQQNVVVGDLQGFIHEAGEALYSHLTRAGRTPVGAAFVVYHGEVNKDSDGPVEVCLPFGGSLEPAGEIRVRLEPAHEEAFTRLSKAQMAFPDILEAYDAVFDWLKAERKHKTAAPREVYFAELGDVGPDEPVCDIAFPYR